MKSQMTKLGNKSILGLSFLLTAVTVSCSKPMTFEELYKKSTVTHDAEALNSISKQMESAVGPKRSVLIKGFQSRVDWSQFTAVLFLEKFKLLDGPTAIILYDSAGPRSSSVREIGYALAKSPPNGKVLLNHAGVCDNPNSQSLVFGYLATGSVSDVLSSLEQPLLSASFVRSCFKDSPVALGKRAALEQWLRSIPVSRLNTYAPETRQELLSLRKSLPDYSETRSTSRKATVRRD